VEEGDLQGDCADGRHHPGILQVAQYKVIARMDDTIPEYFKSPNWMQQLLDG